VASLEAAGSPIPFGETGVLHGILAPLAAAEISIFAISTFDTDYLLVKGSALEAAIRALREAGFTVNDAAG
jgi:uncharacterized protein